MARTRKPQTPESAEVSPEKMRASIPKLQRRVRELEEVDVSTIQQRGEPRLKALELKVEAVLDDIFGHDTVERRRYSVHLDTAGINVMHATPLGEVRAGYQKGIERAVSNLKTIIELFEESLDEAPESSASKARRAFGELDIHPEVFRATDRLFADGHYSNAVEDSCKVLDGLVKMRSGKFDLSGTELMQKVFSPNNPVLKFNDQNTDSEKSEQQGMMFLYAGAMLALRNPRAHGLIEDDPEKALEYIGFISLLAKALDRADRA